MATLTYTRERTDSSNVPTHSPQQLPDGTVVRSTPWKNEDWLRHYYCTEKYSQRDIADAFNRDVDDSDNEISHSAIGYWLNKYGIPTPDAGSNRRIGCRYVTTENETGDGRGGGYECWTLTNKTPDGQDYSRQIRVHRLVAIADGADPSQVFDGYHVHHVDPTGQGKPGIPWLNIPQWLELWDPSHHLAHHARISRRTKS